MIWLLVRRTKFGTAMFAVGSDAEASHAVGISVEWTRFFAFVLGGLFYGMAGVFVSAETGSADPLVGDPLLLQSFTAVVLGGTMLGGGRGSAVGSVIGAYTLMLMINILLALDVSAYFSTIAEGVVLDPRRRGFVDRVEKRSRSSLSVAPVSGCARAPRDCSPARSRPEFRAER